MSTDRRNTLMRAYADATSELRRRHDGEFHEILQEIYDKKGLSVRKRRSRRQAALARIEEARRILGEAPNAD